MQKAPIALLVLVLATLAFAAPTPTEQRLGARGFAKLRNYFFGKHVVVTGATSGIGLELAYALADCGASVTVASRDTTKVWGTVLVLEEHRRVHEKQVFDGLVVDMAAGRELFDTFSEFDAHRAVDVLINNAGMSHPAFLDSMPVDVVEPLIATNLTGPVWATRALAPRFRKRGRGHFAFVGSLAGQINIAGYTVYGATKAALYAFADSLRNELASFGVRITVTLPPDTNTRMLQEENEIKPALTAKLSTGVQPIEATEVADNLLLGMAANSFEVVPGRSARLARWFTRVFPRCARWFVDREAGRFHRAPQPQG